MLQDTPSFLAYWRNARSRTVRVRSVLGPEDLAWAPMPRAFTFGDLFRYLAGLERFMYAENVQGRPSAYPGHGVALASGLGGVRAYVDRCHAESLASHRGRTLAPLFGLTEEQLAAASKPQESQRETPMSTDQS